MMCVAEAQATALYEGERLHASKRFQRCRWKNVMHEQPGGCAVHQTHALDVDVLFGSRQFVPFSTHITVCKGLFRCPHQIIAQNIPAGPIDMPKVAFYNEDNLVPLEMHKVCQECVVGMPVFPKQPSLEIHATAPR